MGRTKGFFGKVGRGLSKPFKKHGVLDRAVSRGGVFDQGLKAGLGIISAPARLMDRGGKFLTSSTLPLVVGGVAVVAVVVATR